MRKAMRRLFRGRGRAGEGTRQPAPADPDGLVPVVKLTFLSDRPRPAAALAAAFIVLASTAASLAYWRADPNADFPLVATGNAVFSKHEIWRLVTTVFVHSGPEHLLANTLLLIVLSYLLFGYYGWLVFPGLALAGATAANWVALLTYPPEIRLMGASGMVYWMGAFWLSLYIAIDTRIGVGGRLLRAVGFALAIFFPTTFSPGVSYRTHAFAFALGLAAALPYFLANRRRFREAEQVVLE